MRFILSHQVFDKLSNLRAAYEQERQISLRTPQSFFTLPTSLGGIDVASRSNQIILLEQIHFLIQDYLAKEPNLNIQLQWQRYLTASRSMLASCLYVLDQINSNRSVLERLIKQCLNINAENYLDAEDQALCFFSAQRFLSAYNELEITNAQLVQNGLAPISEKTFYDLTQFINKGCTTSAIDTPYSNYPITYLTQNTCGTLFRYAGATAGLMAGNALEQSKSLMSSEQKISAFIGSNLLIMSVSGPGTTAVALIIPMLVGRMLATFCTVSLTHILSSVLGIMGEGLGMGLGLPLDLSCILLRKASNCIKLLYKTDGIDSSITGIRLADGIPVLHGVVLNLIPTNQLPSTYKQPCLELKEDGSLLINTLPSGQIQENIYLPFSALNDLKLLLEKEEALVKKIKNNAEKKKQKISSNTSLAYPVIWSNLK